jgi:hypothetical protein
MANRTKQASRRALERRSETPVLDQVLGVAFSAFMEHGYERASTLDIATRAMVLYSTARRHGA